MFVDWQQVVLNLRRAHYPLERASVECGMCKSWLAKFSSSNYAEPSFTVAIKLLQLHRGKCGDAVHSAVFTSPGAIQRSIPEGISRHP